MERQRQCPICGTMFVAVRISQKYCSTSCRKYAYRHGATAHEDDRKGAILRTFTCRRCGKKVAVTSRSDKRTKYCSSHCERMYWKHSKKVHAPVVRRKFVCKYCGKEVEVVMADDRRTRFCSRECCIRYFSLHRHLHTDCTPEDDR